MNTLLSWSIGRYVPASPELTNWGRNAKKKIVSFGLRRLMRTPDTITLRSDRGPASSSTVSAPCSRTLLAHRVPGHQQEIRHAHVLQELERERARVQQRRQSGH